MVHEFGNGLCVLLTVASLRIQLVRLMDELAALQQTFSWYLSSGIAQVQFKLPYKGFNDIELMGCFELRCM